MAKETTMQGRMGRLKRLLARLNGNRGELPQLELSRIRFEELMARIEEAADRQAFHRAAKQEATQELQAFLSEGERLATVALVTVKQHYGIRSEKLADFGLKPFRGLSRKAKPETEPTAPPLPEIPEADRS